MSDLKIKVGDKSYDIPDLDFDHWKKIIAKVEKRNEDATLMTPEGIDDVIDFYFDILHPYHPEVTKAALAKMPVHQGGAEFTAKLLLEIMSVPLGSLPENKQEKASGSKTS